MHTHISLHTLTINTCNTGRNVYKGVQRPELTHILRSTQVTFVSVSYLLLSE